MSTGNNLHCYICDNRAGVSVRNAVFLFAGSTLPSGKLLHETICEILDRKIQNNDSHSNIICKKCFKTCTEYDEMETRLSEIKSGLLAQFKNTATKYNFPHVVKIKKEECGNPEDKPKLVLPASKLKPLPSNYVILNRGDFKTGKFSPETTAIILSKPNPVTPSKINLKVTVGSSILTQTLKTTSSMHISPAKLPTTSQTYTIMNTCEPNTVNVNTTANTTAPSIMNTSVVSILNVNQLLPKDFLTSPTKSDADKSVDLENNEEQPMEIDEECTVGVERDNNTKSEGNLNNMYINRGKEKVKKAKKISPKRASLFEISLLPTLTEGETNMAEPQSNVEEDIDKGRDENQFVIGKIEIMEDENVLDGDEHTILMEDDGSSIIRVVSGQKFICEDNQISLIIPEGSDGESDQNGSDGNTGSKDNDQDSNDESQIEFQVSGDDETANAIIKAAQKRGFIKIKSGAFKVRRDKESSNAMDNTQYIIQKDGDLYKCLLCANIIDKDESSSGVPFTGNPANTMRHVRAAHNARVYICQICGDVMRRRSDYTAHQTAHANETALRSNTVEKGKLHDCTICFRKFSSRNLMLAHMNMHNGNRPYTCQLCKKTFASKYTRQAHMKTHLDRPRPFKCNQCGKSFFTQQNLSQHEKTHSGIKDFVCIICGKAFGTQHNLEIHGVVHSGLKPFVCNVCGKAFARRAEIKDHIRTHTGERPFSCDLCHAMFSQRSNLQSHKRATHYDDKRHACPNCDKRFKRRRLLDYHIKASHTGERPFQCYVCKATFVYPEHYKKHVRIHSGEKPYNCEVCGKSFNSRDNRNAHRFVHSDKKPYECVICGAGFMRKPLLYAHMNNTGHLSESIVVNQPRVVSSEDNSDNMYLETKLLEITDSALEGNEEENKAGEQHIYTVNLDDSASSTRHYSLESDELTGKTTLNLMQDGDDTNILSLNDNSGIKLDVPILECTKQENDKHDIMEQSSAYKILAKDDSGGTVRLVQIQLPDGGTGWVAINQ